MSQPLTNVDDIVKGNCLDAHMWLEDDKGNIIDYPNHILRGVCMFAEPNSKVVRKEFSKELTMLVLPHIQRINAPILKACESSALLRKTVISKAGFCFTRAMLLKQHKPHKKYKVKVGSCGFERADGTVFWEYG